MVGRAGATAAACALFKLNPQQTAYALGVAATTAGGLVGSFGIHAKPFHAGKAAMDGILAAQFEGLCEPVIGSTKSKILFETAQNFEQPGSITNISGLLAGTK